ncbi:MAG: ATP-binding protein [Pseudomonadota bacterium]
MVDDVARLRNELRREVDRRRAAETRLAESEEWLRLILGNLPIIVFTLDRSGRVSLLEGRGTDHLWCVPDDCIGQPVEAVFTTEPGFREAVERVLNGEASRVETYCSERRFEIHQQPLFAGRDEVDGAVGVAIDISERAQVDQLKREFISSVTHELRTPLTSIIGALGLLTGGAMGELPDGAQRMLGIARNNSERLLRLINDILDLDKVDAGRLVFHFRATPLDHLLEQAVESHGPYAAEYGVDLELENQCGMCCILGDADRLLQVFANLLSNAVKHTPEGDRVRVLARLEGERVIVEVVDQGPGVPEAARDHLFERFTPVAATGRGGGSGLGLSIARAVVERHGGHLDFRNREEGGAIFYFDLPRSDCDTVSFSSSSADERAG